MISFKNLTIRKKLLVGFGSIVAISLFSTLYYGYQLETVKDETTELMQKTLVVQDDIVNWKNNIEKNMIREKAISQTGDMSTIKSFKEEMITTSSEINKYQEQITKLIVGKDLNDQLTTSNNARKLYKDIRDKLINEKVENKEITVNLADLNTNREAYKTTINNLQSMVDKKIKSNEEDLISKLNFFEMAFIGLTFITVLLSIFFAYIVSKSILIPIEKSLSLANKIKDGDLTHKVDIVSSDELGKLSLALNEMTSNLKDVMIEIQDNSIEVSNVAEDISKGNSELASRSESQAASLEETAASLEEFTGSVNQSSDNVLNAEQMTKSLATDASQSGEMMKSVINVMESIQTSSKKIAEIVTLIDGIAFQTNLLALNAAVEAARAGDAGRSFSVVASEVRNLAQKTAEASKEIKLLITDSVKKVDTGAHLVNETGVNISRLVESIDNIKSIMLQLTTTTKEQKSGIIQINEAVSHIDGITQENAQLAANASQSSDLLKMQSKHLKQLIERFKYQ